MEFSFSTAAGMFNAAVGTVLIFVSNFVTKRAFGRSIW
jgi:ABC-type polysaccharide transport system permease subunit